MTLRDTFKMGTVLLDGLDMIERMTNIGGTRADIALAAARAGLAALKSGLDGKASPQATLSRIEALHDKLAANDARIDALLREKFRDGAG